MDPGRLWLWGTNLFLIIPCNKSYSTKCWEPQCFKIRSSVSRCQYIGILFGEFVSVQCLFFCSLSFSFASSKSWFIPQELDLNNPKTFRNLSKPMGAQTDDRLIQYKKRFKDWEDPTGESETPVDDLLAVLVMLKLLKHVLVSSQARLQHIIMALITPLQWLWPHIWSEWSHSHRSFSGFRLVLHGLLFSSFVAFFSLLSVLVFV